LAGPAGFDAKTQLEKVPFRGFMPLVVETLLMKGRNVLELWGLLISMLGKTEQLCK
jgi:hypothetical protein